MNKESEKNSIEQALSSISLQSIVSGFKKYRKTFMKVLQYRGRYAAAEISSESPDMLGSAISTFFYGVALSFVIYLPLIQKHGLNLEKLYFLLQFVYSQCLLVSLIHLSAKIFRGHGTIRQTTAMYCIWLGIISPIFLIANYPLFMYVRFEDFINFGSFPNTLIPHWVTIWNLVVFCLFLIIAFMFVHRWIADIHGITRLRLTLALVVIYMPIMAVHTYTIAPYVSKALRSVSSTLQKLI